MYAEPFISSALAFAALTIASPGASFLGRIESECEYKAIKMIFSCKN
jgi:hypothetical protein